MAHAFAQLGTSAPSSLASAEALIFFCLLFFYQEKKRRNPSACVCFRKGINTGIRIQSFDPRGSSVGRMQYAPTNGDAPLDPLTCVCPLPGSFVGRMLLRLYIEGCAHRPPPSHLSPAGAICGAYAIRPYTGRLRPSTLFYASVPCRGHLWGVCFCALQTGMALGLPFSFSFLDAPKYIGRNGLFFR